MPATIVFEIRSRGEARLAERALKGRGYAIARAGGDPCRIQVRALPGEKPEAALMAVGVGFSRALVVPATPAGVQ
jgi:hypothetical protein